MSSVWKRGSDQILNQIYGQHRFINTLDNQKEGKHLYFSSELLEEEICYRITHKKEHNNNQRCHSHCFISKSKMSDPLTSVRLN